MATIFTQHVYRHLPVVKDKQLLGVIRITSYNVCYTKLLRGLLYFLPIYLVTLVAGGLWEVLFAAVRNHEVNEGFLVTSMLFSLTLPPTIPLWQVAVGISFGVRNNFV